jgi:hypothetical protein
MISERHVEGNWLTHTRIASSHYQDPGLSTLLVAPLVMIFLAEPLAFEGFVPPVVVTGIVVAGLVFLLVLGSHHKQTNLVGHSDNSCEDDKELICVPDSASFECCDSCEVSNRGRERIIRTSTLGTSNQALQGPCKAGMRKSFG